ncbi:MAG: glycosyltransferase family 9 protein [Candidatus Pacearchaeota archaeon]|jgi:ADP-heptose:LPS heptosyltransferase
MSKKINFKEFSIAREISPLIKIRIKKIGGFFSKKPEIKSKKVLIVDTCIIGDFLATLPAIREIAKNHKNVDLIVSPPVKSLAERINGIENVFVAKTSYNREIENGEDGFYNLLKEYEKIVILRISPESYNLIKNIKFSNVMASDWVYFKYIFHMAKNIFIRKPIKQSREVMFEIINVKKDRKKIDREINLSQMFKFKQSDYKKIEKIPELNLREKKILIHTGSGWESRLWQNEKWAELLEKINKIGKFKLIFVGSGEQEEKSFEHIKKMVSFKIYSLIGKLDLKELFLVMKESDYFIGADSGPRNLAHLADLRSISLRGPGPYFMPLNKKDIVIDNLNGLSAMPFFSNKNNSASSIGVDKVFIAFKKLLRNKR